MVTAKRRSAGPRPSGGLDVFIIRGRNNEAYERLCQLLKAVGLRPFDFDDAVAKLVARGQDASPYAGTVIDTALVEASAAVAMLTGDEVSELLAHFAQPKDIQADEHRPQLQARPNVIFETGYALGKCPDRTMIVSIGRTKPFSDIAGRHYLDLTNSLKSKIAFIERLRGAGCSIGAWSDSEIADIDFESVERQSGLHFDQVRTSRARLDRLSLSLHRTFDRTADESEQFLIDRLSDAKERVFLFGVGRQLYLSPRVVAALESTGRRIAVDLFVSDPFCDNRSERYRLEPTKADRPIAYGPKVAAHQSDPVGFVRGVGNGLMELERRVANSESMSAGAGLRLYWHDLPLNMVIEKFDDWICVSLYGYKQRAADSPIFVYRPENAPYRFFAEQAEWIRTRSHEVYSVITTEAFLERRRSSLTPQRGDGIDAGGAHGRDVAGEGDDGQQHDQRADERQRIR
jgi:hypothetical protein